MHSYKNITLVGTSHISSHSIKEIEKAFERIDPGIVALELDVARMHALLTNQKNDYNPRMIRQIGLQGYLFALIGGMMQKKLGDFVGVKPGSEMLTALQLAHKNNKRIFLIDRDLRVTLRRLSALFGWREKFRILKDLLFSPFSSKKMKVDLTKVPEKKLVTELNSLLEQRYPGLYNSLVKERNEVMVNNLLHLMQTHPEEKILAVVGAGHVEGMMALLRRSKNINSQ